jgi:hypothetical protein
LLKSVDIQIFFLNDFDIGVQKHNLAIDYGSNDSQTRTYYGIKATSYYDDVYVLNNSVYNILSAGGGIAMGGDSDYHRRGYLIGNLCEGNSENFVLTAFIKEVRDNISRQFNRVNPFLVERVR